MQSPLRGAVLRFSTCYALLLGSALTLASSLALASQPLAPNDVTWLFPPPVNAADLKNLLSIKDINFAPDPANPTKRSPIWPDAAFQDFLNIAAGDAGLVDGTTDHIGLPSEALDQANWFVAGVRIDPGAPSLDPEVVKVYGRRAQIRIIIQPVNRAGGGRLVDDVAGHLIYDFVQKPTPAELVGCPFHATPEDVTFRTVVDGVAALRDRLANGDFGPKVSTANEALEVHPGLANVAARAKLTAAMQEFLEANLSDVRLHAMSLMATPKGAAAPWIFVSMNKADGQEHFQPVRGPTLSGAQFAMEFTGGSVQPSPHANNNVAITCASAVFGPAALPVSSRHGESTSDLMGGGNQSTDQRTEVFNRIADTGQSHFFNTDCVSCHTATRMQVDATGAGSIAGVSQASVQTGPYDVHNFSWSTDVGLRGSIARRTQTETADVVAWLNTHMPPR